MPLWNRDNIDNVQVGILCTLKLQQGVGWTKTSLNEVPIIFVPILNLYMVEICLEFFCYLCYMPCCLIKLLHHQALICRLVRHEYFTNFSAVADSFQGELWNWRSWWLFWPIWVRVVKFLLLIILNEQSITNLAYTKKYKSYKHVLKWNEIENNKFLFFSFTFEFCPCIGRKK